MDQNLLPRQQSASRDIPTPSRTPLRTRVDKLLRRVLRCMLIRPTTSTSLLPGNINMANVLGAVETTPAVPPRMNIPTPTLFTRALDKKVSGPDVVALQNILRSQGFLKALSTDYYGPATEQAVRRYQTKHAITATGAVGTQTLAQLVQDEK